MGYFIWRLPTQKNYIWYSVLKEKHVQNFFDKPIFVDKMYKNFLKIEEKLLK